VKKFKQARVNGGSNYDSLLVVTQGVAIVNTATFWVLLSRLVCAIVRWRELWYFWEDRVTLSPLAPKGV